MLALAQADPGDRVPSCRRRYTCAPRRGEGVSPTAPAAGDYPLRATILAVAPTAPEEATLAFLAWIQSPPGQAIVARRYLPLD